jgi:hypothetical protein
MIDDMLGDPEHCEAVLFKIVTPNDDAGRHGVLIPVSAYAMFPPIEGFDANARLNYTSSITFLWEGEDANEITGRYKHYHRYPERRLTRLPACFNNCLDGAAILIAKIAHRPWTYEIHLLQPDDERLEVLMNEFGLVEPRAGTYFLDLAHHPRTHYELPASMVRLVALFDEVSARGYIRTLRQGPTGVGYTFETLLGIAENNYRGPDFEGNEIKCYRLGRRNNNVKKNLFLREPRWIDGQRDMASRVRAYGYIDADGRSALYSAVTSCPNCHTFSLEASPDDEKIFLTFDGERVAEWTFVQLQERLDEKLTHTAFIGALKRGNGAREEFHYKTFTYCRHPSIESFTALITSGHVILELRLHVKENGTVRNHGSAFRLPEDNLPDLFAEVRGMREE